VDSSVVIVGTVLVAACETKARSTAAQDSVALDRVTVDLSLSPRRTSQSRADARETEVERRDAA